MKNRIIKLILADALASGLALYIAFLLRFEFFIPREHLFVLFQWLPFFIIIQVVIFYLFGLYARIWRFTSLFDLLAILRATILSCILSFVGVLLIMGNTGYPRSVLILYFILNIIMSSLIRLSVRIYYSHYHNSSSLKVGNKKKLLLVGAGKTGEKIAKEIIDQSQTDPIVMKGQDISDIEAVLRAILDQISQMAAAQSTDSLPSPAEREAADAEAAPNAESDAEASGLKPGPAGTKVKNPKMIFNTGCPSIDLALKISKNKKLTFDPYIKYGGVGSFPDLSAGYLVVMQHPVTNEYIDSRKNIEITLRAISKLKLTTLWFWPNIDAGSDGTSSGIRAFRESNKLKNVHFFKNMNGLDFLNLLDNSIALVGNSSVGIRECSFLGIPVINIGTRQNRRLRSSNVTDINYNVEEIIDSVNKVMKQNIRKKSKIYGDGNSGKKIAQILSKVPLTFHKTISY